MLRHAQLGKEFPRCRAVALCFPAKKNSFASELAGALFVSNAWLVAFTKCSQIFSTQHLTWLIIGVILHLEQRRGHKEIRKRVPNQSSEKLFQHSRKKDASDLLKTV